VVLQGHHDIHNKRLKDLSDSSLSSHRCGDNVEFGFVKVDSCFFFFFILKMYARSWVQDLGILRRILRSLPMASASDVVFGIP